MSPPLSRQRCSELCPGWQHPLAGPSLPGAPQGTAALAEVGWDWPGEPGSARQGCQKAPHHCRGQERQRVKFPLQPSHLLLRDAPCSIPGSQGCFLPQVLAGDQMFHALPGQSTFTPTASRLLSPLGKERAGKQRGSHCTFLLHLPLSFPTPPRAPEPASGSQVQPDGTAAQSLNAWNRQSREFWTGEFILRSPPVKSSIVSKFQTSFHWALLKPSLTTSQDIPGIRSVCCFGSGIYWVFYREEKKKPLLFMGQLLHTAVSALRFYCSQS